MGKGTKCSGIATGACASFLSQRGPEECSPVIGWTLLDKNLFTIPYPENVFIIFRSICCTPDVHTKLIHTSFTL